MGAAVNSNPHCMLFQKDEEEEGVKTVSGMFHLYSICSKVSSSTEYEICQDVFSKNFQVSSS